MICNKLQKEIWESGGDVGNLSDAGRLHLESCLACQEELALVKTTVKAFSTIEVPDSWDCKSYVNGRISRIPSRSRAFGPVYATALVACLLAVVSWSNFSEIIETDDPVVMRTTVQPEIENEADAGSTEIKNRLPGPDSVKAPTPLQPPAPGNARPSPVAEVRHKPEAVKSVGGSITAGDTNPTVQPARPGSNIVIFAFEHTNKVRSVEEEPANAVADAPMTVASNPPPEIYYFSVTEADSKRDLSGNHGLTAADHLEKATTNASEPPVISWSADDDADMSYDISVTNPETGKTTRSYGRRAGNMITVNSGVVAAGPDASAGDEGRM